MADSLGARLRQQRERQQIALASIAEQTKINLSLLDKLPSAQIKSEIGDIVNSAGRYGGAVTAAAFLREFVGETPWAHLDIAGTAWTTKEMPYYVKGATGFGVLGRCPRLR